jgi:hypothetical protein
MHPRFAIRGFLPVVTVLLQLASPIARELHVVVSSGDYDRAESPVHFFLPKDAPSPPRLIDADGAAVPFQVSEAGEASFILRKLDRGKQTEFRIVQDAATKSASTVKAVRNESALRIAIDGQPAVSYQAEPGPLPRANIKPLFARGGYLHPVLSPSGRLVTDDYPPNHVHHHGIWFPWTKTEFEGRYPDFWNMGDGKGRVEHVALDKAWDGPVHGGFQARHQFVDLTWNEPRTALFETWEIRVYNIQLSGRPARLFDLYSSQNCATTSPLVLPEYHYGGLGVRGNWSWNGADKTFFLTSEGETDRVKGNQTRARWCHMGGVVDGELTGIAILCHPGNFRAPQPMRIHPTEPFFCYAPSQLGQWEIRPGNSYQSRYRFVVQDGAPDRAALDRFWNDYANPPTVEIR